MSQFTITGMRDDELEWIRSEMERQGMPGSIVMRNLINKKRREQSREKLSDRSDGSK